MKAAGISEHRLAEVTRISRSAVRQYRSGYNLPALETGLVLAAALDSDELAALIRRCRTVSCATCQAAFVSPGLGSKRYCSARCRQVARKLVDGLDVRQRADMAEASWMSDHVVACRTCEAPIAWHRHADTGRSAPLDSVPTGEGNCLVDEPSGTYRVLAGQQLAAARARGEVLRTNHFTTCRDRELWKRRAYTSGRESAGLPGLPAGGGR